MKPNLLLFTLALLFFVAVVKAQTSFTKTYWAYTGSYGDEGTEVQQTADGGYIIAAACTTDVGDGGSFIIKTKANGDTSWIKRWTKGNVLPAYSYASSIQQTTDAGYIVGGSVWGSGSFLIKTNSSGDTMWQKSYSSTGINSVRQITGGGFIATGDPFFLQKTDANGFQTLYKNYTGSSGMSVQATSDGGYIIAGTSTNDIYVLKTNAAGDSIWSKNYGGYGSWGVYIQQTSDNGYIICSTATGFTGIYLIKTNAAGDTTWTKTFGTNGDYGKCVQQTSDGGYILTGMMNSGMIFMKTNSSGVVQWTKTFKKYQYAHGNSIRLTTDGGYVAVGYVDSTTSSFGPGDVYLVKTDGNGNVTATREIDMIQDGISLYPNPSQGRFTVSCSQFTVNGTIDVFNVLGEKVYTEPFNGKEKTVECKLSEGIYFVRVRNGEKMYSQKIIVE